MLVVGGLVGYGSPLSNPAAVSFKTVVTVVKPLIQNTIFEKNAKCRLVQYHTEVRFLS